MKIIMGKRKKFFMEETTKEKKLTKKQLKKPMKKLKKKLKTQKIII